MATISFLKMHGLGNDFAIFDARNAPLSFTQAQVKYIADRRFGIGCDQVIVIEPAQDADAFMRIYNPDGSESSACGNATRCVAWLLAEELGKREVALKTRAGLLMCVIQEDGLVQVDMGMPKVQWQEIPLAQAEDTLHVQLPTLALTDGVAVNMGNPHIVFFVADVADVNLSSIGAAVECSPMFPERVNVSVAALAGENEITLRVWERGAGLTLACGTAACATLVAAVRRGLTGKEARIHLPGGDLSIAWHDDGHVYMTGPVAIAYCGQVVL